MYVSWNILGIEQETEKAVLVEVEAENGIRKKTWIPKSVTNRKYIERWFEAILDKRLLPLRAG